MIIFLNKRRQKATLSALAEKGTTSPFPLFSIPSDINPLSCANSH